MAPKNTPTQAPDRITVRLDSDVRALITHRLWADPSESITTIVNAAVRAALAGGES